MWTWFPLTFFLHLFQKKTLLEKRQRFFFVFTSCQSTNTDSVSASKEAQGTDENQKNLPVTSSVIIIWLDSYQKGHHSLHAGPPPTTLAYDI